MRIRRRIVALLSLAFFGFGVAQAQAATAAEVDIPIRRDYGICIAIPIVYVGICY